MTSTSSSGEAQAQAQAQGEEALIPGLPDEVALSCLLRLPYSTQATARAVCKAWKRLLTSRAAYLEARRRLHLTRPWLVVLASHRATRKLQWQACELSGRGGAWHILSPMPDPLGPGSGSGSGPGYGPGSGYGPDPDPLCPSGFGCVAGPRASDDSALFVCGGIRSSGTEPLDSLLRFDLFTNTWSALGPMSTPRSFFACAAIGPEIYVAGGNNHNHHNHNNNNQNEPTSADTARFFGTSAEAYDPASDTWRPIASMRASMARYDSAVLRGKLHVTEGWAWPFLASPRGEVYDPGTDAWECMPAAMREGWTGLSVVHRDTLYVISEHDSSKLKAFDTESGSWRDLGGSPMPAHMELPICVNAIFDHELILVVVAKNLHVALGTLSGDPGTMPDPHGNPMHSVDWQSILAPDRFRDFSPSHAVILYV